MKTGFTFTNQDMQLTCLCFAESKRGNIALLIDHKNGLFITVRDVSRENNGDYSWSWGHYFKDKRNEKKEFDRRKNRIKF